MRSKSRLQNQSGMAMMAVMVMLLIMSLVGVGMYKLLDSVIGVSAGYHRKATTRSVAIAQAALVMETLAQAHQEGFLVTVGDLALGDGKTADEVYRQAFGGMDVDYTDSADPRFRNDGTDRWSPDFVLNFDGRTAFADVDFLHSIQLAGGSLEFASGYDGAGQGAAGSTVQETQVTIFSEGDAGSRTVLRFVVSN